MPEAPQLRGGGPGTPAQGPEPEPLLCTACPGLSEGRALGLIRFLSLSAILYLTQSHCLTTRLPTAASGPAQPRPEPQPVWLNGPRRPHPPDPSPLSAEITLTHQTSRQLAALTSAAGSAFLLNLKGGRGIPQK